MISYCCGSNSPPQAENFSVSEVNIEFPPFENMISQCKCLHTEKILHKMYVNILFEIRLYVNMFTYYMIQLRKVCTTVLHFVEFSRVGIDFGKAVQSGPRTLIF